MLTVDSRAAGTAYLKFARSATGTILERCFATSPAKVFATKGGETACWAYAATLGGGFVGGDDVRMTIDVADGSRAFLATQASTKVYRSLRQATQSVTAVVGPGALLVVAPDPIVCFSGADFAQRQRYELRGDASLVVIDWMTSGRHATGERWVFSRYESRLAIARDAGPVLADALVLERNLDSVAARMGRFDVLLTAVLTGPLVSGGAMMVHDSIARSAIRRDSDLILSASTLNDGGVLLRMAGTSVERVARAIRDALDFLPALLGDDPWSRKW